jgi:phage tail-like protein
MEEKESIHPVGFYFSISFNDTEQGFFQEISGLSNETNVEEVVGGENRFKYRLPTTTSNKNLVLKRGVVPKDSALLTWCVDSIDGGLATPIQTKEITICLLDQNEVVSMKWVFNNAYPVKYSVSDLKSQENEVLVETIELSYTYFLVSPVN